MLLKLSDWEQNIFLVRFKGTDLNENISYLSPLFQCVVNYDYQGDQMSL
jgi:hypothetical protein